MMTKKRRILILHLGRTFGGIEVYLGNLAQLLREDVEVIALCSQPEVSKVLRARSVRVLGIPEFTGPLRGLRFLLAAILLPFVVWKHRIDTVQVNGQWESMFLVPARLLGCRTVAVRHQTYDVPLRGWWHSPRRTLSSFTYNFNAQFAHVVICVSEAVASEVRRAVVAEKVMVIPNWIPSSPRYGERVVHSGSSRLLFVGRMVTSKGLRLLLEAIREMPDVSLTVVGAGKLLRELQQQAKGLDVSFLGFRENVQRFYDAADIFVMPSLGLEGLPLVSIEAMGNGLPCLFSDLPVHREITDGGRVARLFRSGDSADLGRQLRSLIADKKGRAQMACAAYQRVQELYTADAAHASYVKAFDLLPFAASNVPCDLQIAEQRH